MSHKFDVRLERYRGPDRSKQNAADPVMPTFLEVPELVASVSR